MDGPQGKAGQKGDVGPAGPKGEPGVSDSKKNQPSMGSSANNQRAMLIRDEGNFKTPLNVSLLLVTPLHSILTPKTPQNSDRQPERYSDLDPERKIQVTVTNQHQLFFLV